MVFFGPKTIFCGLFVSVWGSVQLFSMGFGYYFHVITLSEDVDLEEIIEQSKTIPEVFRKIDERFAMHAYQCWIACGLYAVLFLFFLYIHFNNKKTS